MRPYQHIRKIYTTCSVRFFASLFIVVSMSTVTAFGQPQYRATDLGTLQNGAANSWAWDLNDAGEVVGYADAPNEMSIHGFLYQNGEMIDLKTLGTPYSWAYGINNRTQITGYSGVNSLTIHAFLWEDGTMRDIGHPPYARGTFSRGNDINERGVITGIAHSSKSAFVIPYTPFRYFEGQWQELETFGGADGHGYAINDRLDVVGWAEFAEPDPQAPRAAMWTLKQIIDLGTLGNHQGWGEDVNNHREVVGWSFDGDGNERAFLWVDGVMTDLGDLGGAKSWAYGINQKGEIVGSAQTADEERHAMFIDSARVIHDLNTLVDPPLDVTLRSSRSINELGQIIANAELADGTRHAYLLTPIDLPELSVPVPGLAGTENTLTVSNLVPESTAYFAYSLDSHAKRALPGCGRVVTSLGSPKLFGSAVADANGDAALTLFVPDAAAGVQLAFQAAVLEECHVSNLRWFSFE